MCVSQRQRFNPLPYSIMKNILGALTAILLALSAFLISCDDSPNDVCNPVPQFDIDLFVEKVGEQLNDPAQPVSGYQFVVSRNGNLYHSEAGGVSVHENDPNGPIDMTVNTRMNVASVSKFIGAMALMKAMEDNNISLEFNIVNYLPDTWRSLVNQAHRDVDSDAYLTFRKLMRMETAINFPGSNPPSGDMLTEAQMLQGLRNTPAMNRVGTYQNANFTLIRVLIGEIVYNLDETSTNYATECTDKYFEYLKENIFDPLEIYPPMSAQQINDYYDVTVYSLAYQWPFNANFQNATTGGGPGWAHTSSPYRNGGSGGLVLSAMDIAKVMAFFRHDNNETIISQTQRDKILESELGLTESSNGDHGLYPSKGGTRGPDNCCSRAIRSRIIFLPGGVEAVVLSNSNITTLGSMLRTAYDDSWVPGC